LLEFVDLLCLLFDAETKPLIKVLYGCFDVLGFLALDLVKKF
jgi:hypothetical protein